MNVYIFMFQIIIKNDYKVLDYKNFKIEHILESYKIR